MSGGNRGAQPPAQTLNSRCANPVLHRMASPMVPTLQAHHLRPTLSQSGGPGAQPPAKKRSSRCARGLPWQVPWYCSCENVCLQACHLSICVPSVLWDTDFLLCLSVGRIQNRIFALTKHDVLCLLPVFVCSMELGWNGKFVFCPCFACLLNVFHRFTNF